MAVLHLATTVAFPASTAKFVPTAVGFFGLGTGYLIYGPQELFGFPKTRQGGRPCNRYLGYLDAGVHAVPDRGLPSARVPSGTPRLGGWLMYLTWATVLSFASGFHLTL
jgi:hypothetical protein